MVTLEKIQSSLFSNLYESFLIDDDPLSSEQDWRRMFDYPWPTEEGHCGYALLDQGKVVGMLGMIFSERWIQGKWEKFCNLHTWWVREDHRGRSLSLLRPLLKLEGYTINFFAPDDTIRTVTKRLGFSELSSQLKILMPLGFLPGGSRIERESEQAALIFDDMVIEGSLAEHDKKILQDHLPYGVGNLLIGDGKEYCYLLYTYVVRHRLPYCHIHYVSNKDVYASREKLIRSSLMRKHKARFVAVDSRLVQDLKFPRSFNFWAPANAVYKSSRVAPNQIDNLYSDVVFLKLSTLPTMTHELKEVARQWWPFAKPATALF